MRCDTIPYGLDININTIVLTHIGHYTYIMYVVNSYTSYTDRMLNTIIYRNA